MIVQAEELNTIVSNAFKMAYAVQRENESLQQDLSTAAGDQNEAQGAGTVSAQPTFQVVTSRLRT